MTSLFDQKMHTVLKIPPHSVSALLCNPHKGTQAKLLLENHGSLCSFFSVMRMSYRGIVFMTVFFTQCAFCWSKKDVTSKKCTIWTT